MTKSKGQELLDSLAEQHSALKELGFERVPSLQVQKAGTGGGRIKTSVKSTDSMIVVILFGGQHYMRTVTADDIDKILSSE